MVLAIVQLRCVFLGENSSSEWQSRALFSCVWVWGYWLLNCSAWTNTFSHRFPMLNILSKKAEGVGLQGMCLTSQILAPMGCVNWFGSFTGEKNFSVIPTGWCPFEAREENNKKKRRRSWYWFGWPWDQSLPLPIPWADGVGCADEASEDGPLLLAAWGRGYG